MYDVLDLTRIIGLAFLLYVLTFSADAQSRYNILYEQQSGMHFAAENISTALHFIDYLDSLYIPKNINQNENQDLQFLDPLYRFGKLFLTNYLITDFLLTMNHERFGHGYRVLQVDGGAINHITYNPPPPFSNDFSYINYTLNSSYTEQERLLVTLGGSETNLVLSDILRKNILLDEQLNYTYAFPYLYASNDAPGYTAFVTNTNADPVRYRENINAYYGSNKLTNGKMLTYSMLALLTDPINFFAFKSVFYDYLIHGRHSSRINMIRFSDGLKYLPRFRFEYTPFGPELVLQNYFKLDQKLFLLSFSHSDGTFDPSHRLLMQVWNLKLSKKVSFNISGQLWKQPDIEYYNNENLKTSAGTGAQLITVSNFDFISNRHILGATLHLGYKTAGYSLGEQLNKGLIARAGLTLRLGNELKK